jgi:hypothetical protein
MNRREFRQRYGLRRQSAASTALLSARGAWKFRSRVVRTKAVSRSALPAQSKMLARVIGDAKIFRTLRGSTLLRPGQALSVRRSPQTLSREQVFHYLSMM